jgi:hypothetical protein
MIKKTPHMTVERYTPPKLKPKIKPLNPEMGIRTKNALLRLLKDGDITRSEYNALWCKTLERVKAGV